MEGDVKGTKPTSRASKTDAVSSENDGSRVVNVFAMNFLVSLQGKRPYL